MKLELPNRFQFTTDLNVRIGDINYGGHLGNDAMLSLIHEARVQFLKRLRYAEHNIEGVGIIMADAVVVYKENHQCAPEVCEAMRRPVTFLL